MRAVAARAPNSASDDDDLQADDTRDDRALVVSRDIRVCMLETRRFPAILSLSILLRCSHFSHP